MNTSSRPIPYNPEEIEKLMKEMVDALETPQSTSVMRLPPGVRLMQGNRKQRRAQMAEKRKK